MQLDAQMFIDVFVFFGVGLVFGVPQESLFADMESVTRMIAEYRKIVQSLSESEVSGENICIHIPIHIYILV